MASPREEFLSICKEAETIYDNAMNNENIGENARRTYRKDFNRTLKRFGRLKSQRDGIRSWIIRFQGKPIPTDETLRKQARGFMDELIILQEALMKASKEEKGITSQSSSETHLVEPPVDQQPQPIANLFGQQTAPNAQSGGNNYGIGARIMDPRELNALFDSRSEADISASGRGSGSQRLASAYRGPAAQSMPQFRSAQVGGDAPERYSSTESVVLSPLGAPPSRHRLEYAGGSATALPEALAASPHPRSLPPQRPRGHRSGLSAGTFGDMSLKSSNSGGSSGYQASTSSYGRHSSESGNSSSRSTHASHGHGGSTPSMHPSAPYYASASHASVTQQQQQQQSYPSQGSGGQSAYHGQTYQGQYGQAPYPVQGQQGQPQYAQQSQSQYSQQGQAQYPQQGPSSQHSTQGYQQAYGSHGGGFQYPGPGNSGWGQ